MTMPILMSPPPDLWATPSSPFSALSFPDLAPFAGVGVLVIRDVPPEPPSPTPTAKVALEVVVSDADGKSNQRH